MMDEVCGVTHPTEHGLACERPPGTNAYNDIDGVNVHQHWAHRRGDDAIFRWEDSEPGGA